MFFTAETTYRWGVGEWCEVGMFESLFLHTSIILFINLPLLPLCSLLPIWHSVSHSAPMELVLGKYGVRLFLSVLWLERPSATVYKSQTNQSLVWMSQVFTPAAISYHSGRLVTSQRWVKTYNDQYTKLGGMLSAVMMGAFFKLTQCSKGCAGGVRYRQVYCAIPLNGTRVHDYRCVEIYGPLQTPPSYDICFNRCKQTSNDVQDYETIRACVSSRYSSEWQHKVYNHLASSFCPAFVPQRDAFFYRLPT